MYFNNNQKKNRIPVDLFFEKLLVKYLNISKVTVGRYLASSKVYNNKYYMKYI